MQLVFQYSRLARQDLISKLYYILEIQVSFLEAPHLSKVLSNLLNSASALWDVGRRLCVGWGGDYAYLNGALATGIKQILQWGLFLVEELWRQASSLDISAYPQALPPTLAHFPRKTLLRKEKGLRATYFLQGKGSCGNWEWAQLLRQN